MTANYETLLANRRKWKPTYLTPTPYDIEDGGVPVVIERILALALHLEIPVGNWITAATRRDLPVSDSALKLLRSNIGDENLHNIAFKRAIAAYPVSGSVMKDAESIAQEWIISPAHPLEKAALLECGVFMMSLAVMNICGGRSLFNLANNISRDEQRHIVTNRSVLREIGVDPQQPTPHLDVFRYHTLDWMFDSLNIPELVIDKDWFIQQSTRLVCTGRSPELSELTGGANYTPPFEVSNKALY